MSNAIIGQSRFAVALIVTAVSLGSAGAAVTPQQQCQAGKDKAAGTYARCRLKAAAKLATSKDVIKYNDGIVKCGTKVATLWNKIEATAAAKGATCLDGTGTEPQFTAVANDYTTNVATALGGGVLVRCGNGIKDGVEACDGGDLGGQSCTSFGFAGGTLACTTGCGLDTSGCQPIVCGNGLIDAGEQCDQSNLNGHTCADLGFAFGALACGAGCVFDTTGCYSPPRLTDNGDGTITDHETGLMWEKKAALDGVPVTCTSGAACPDPHDGDNQYTWTDSTTPSALPTGTAFTVFLAQLNGGSGFAGHTDWRLPALAEIHGLVDYADATSPLVNAVFDAGCTGSCTITTCSCTTPSRYWSDSSLASTPTAAWVVDPGNGEVTWDMKDANYAVRAVRTGP